VPWDDGLEGPALQFAGTPSATVRALAGPGTGKTFALIRRLTRLIEAGTPPERILVLTFARTAAIDLVQKLEALEHHAVHNVPARTLHSYCFSVLTSQAFIVAMGRKARIILEFERDYLLRDVQGDFAGGLRERRKMLQALVAAWARLQAEAPGQPVDGLDQSFQDALLAVLRWHQCMLIGEVVPLALSYLEHNPAAPERAAQDHVLVDEYQDLNKAEQVLVDLLRGPGNLAVIGDDDQSIYRTLKYANPEGIREFPETHQGTEDIAFTVCRRCPRRVVALAQALIQRNPGRVRGPLVPRPENPEGEVYNIQWQSIPDEAEGIATFIAYHVAHGVNPGKCLVLANSRQIGYAIRDAVTALNIEIRSFFREEAVESLAAQEKLTLLTLFANPHDRMALRAWIGLGSASAYSGAYRRLVAAADAENTDIKTILAKLASGEIAIPYSAPALERWNELQEHLAELEPYRNDRPALVDQLLPLPANPGEEDEFELLRGAANTAIEEGGSLASLPDRIRYFIGQPDVPLETPYARVMSFHKSKGLDAELVVLAGLAEGLMPRIDTDESQAEQTAQLQEQRRVFFVGMTRSTRILVFSSYSMLVDHVVHRLQVRRGVRVADHFRTFPSRFLAETGPQMTVAIPGQQWIAAY
jgi:DNA helicase-2/ATP-dependent DNA helicase PcrA